MLLRDGLVLFRVLLVQSYLRGGIFDRRPNNDVTPVTAWDRTADQNHFLGLAHLHHLQILHGHALVTEVTGHSHVFPNAARRGTIPHGSVTPVRFRSVGRALPIEVVLLHHTLETFAFRASNHVDKIARLKLGDGEIHFNFSQIAR